MASSPEYNRGYAQGFKDGRREVNQGVVLALEDVVAVCDSAPPLELIARLSRSVDAARAVLAKANKPTP